MNNLQTGSTLEIDHTLYSDYFESKLRKLLELISKKCIIWKTKLSLSFEVKAQAWFSFEKLGSNSPYYLCRWSARRVWVQEAFFQFHFLFHELWQSRSPELTSNLASRLDLLEQSPAPMLETSRSIQMSVMLLAHICNIRMK